MHLYLPHSSERWNLWNLAATSSEVPPAGMNSVELQGSAGQNLLRRNVPSQVSLLTKVYSDLYTAYPYDLIYLIYPKLHPKCFISACHS